MADITTAEKTSSQRPRWRRPLWVTVAVAFVLVALVAEWGTRNAEMGRLLAAVERSEAAMVAAGDSLSNVMSKAGPYWDDAERFEIRDVAADGMGELIIARERVAEVLVLPWHRSIARARRSYLRHSAAWERYLESGSKREGALAEPAPEIHATFVTVGRHMRDAVPPGATGDVEERVERIFTD